MVLGHVLVHILGLDLKEKAVSVRVEELAALSILRFKLVIIEVVQQVLGEIQNAHAHIHRAIEYQVALVDMDSCQIIVEDIGSSKCRAGDEAPEFVLLIRTHQLHINPLPQVFHGLPEDRVVRQTCVVYLKVAGGLLPELCTSKGFGRTGGRDGLWSEMCIAVDSDSVAHSGPCYGGLGPAPTFVGAIPTPRRLC